MQTPKSEPAAVRRAVLESVREGAVTNDLAQLVHQIAARRCCPGLAEDVGQTVLLGLVKGLGKIDPEKDVYAYVCGAVLNAWRRILRGRRRERKYTLFRMGELIKEIPSKYRPTARGQAVASWEQVSRLKYYA